MKTLLLIPFFFLCLQSFSQVDMNAYCYRPYVIKNTASWVSGGGLAVGSTCMFLFADDMTRGRAGVSAAGTILFSWGSYYVIKHIQVHKLMKKHGLKKNKRRH